MVLTRLPELLLALRFCDSACKKLFRVLSLLPDSPNALSRFWKLCCRSEVDDVLEVVLSVLELVLVVVLLELLDDDSSLIRLCRSDCNCAGPPAPGGGGGRLPELAETPDVELLPLSELLLSDVLLSLCACRFCSRFCRKVVSAWPTSVVLELLLLEDESDEALLSLLELESALVLELVLELEPPTPICARACTMASTRPPPDGGSGGVLPSTLRVELLCLVLPTCVSCAIEKLLDMPLIVMLIPFEMRTELVWFEELEHIQLPATATVGLLMASRQCLWRLPEDARSRGLL